MEKVCPWLETWSIMPVAEKGNYTYILRCGDGTLYTGWTNDLVNRLSNHNAGLGSKYTRTRLPVTLVYYESFETKQQAMSREWHIKRMNRRQKLALIQSDICVSTGPVD